MKDSAIKRREELKNEISSFAVHYQLTPRETEIMGLLCVGTTRIKEIAEHLSLSPNTINNHINSIFAKSKARSKSELLSFFLEFLIKRIDLISGYARAPKILFLHDDTEACNEVPEKLRQRGFWVEETGEVNSALAMLRETPFDVVAYCNGETDRPWHVLVKAAQACGVSSPSVITIGKVSVGLIDALDAGLADVVESPNPDAIYESIRKSYTGAPFRPQKEKLLTGDVADFDLTPENLGRGGVFVPQESIQNDSTTLGVGDYIELGMNVSGRRLRGRGQIAWRRISGSEPKGYGVRFTQLPAEDVSVLFKIMHDARIRSFIPAAKKYKYK